MRSASAILLLLFAIMAVKAAPSTKENRKVIRVPFRVVKHPKRRLSMADRMTTIATLPKLDELVRRSTGLVSLESFDNLYWQGDFSLGTPPQPFQVIFDTADFNTWVPDATCGDACKELSMYNGKASSSFVDKAQPGDIAYSGGLTVSGTWTTDVLTLTDQVHLQQDFVRANVVPQFFSDLGSAGIVGLGFALQGQTPSLIDNLKSQNLLDKDQVSCRFIKDTEGTGEGLGELLFGGVDQEFVDGDILYIPIALVQSGDHYWIIPVEDMQYQGKSMANPSNACINTAADFTSVSDGAAENLYGVIKGAEKNSDGLWVVPRPFPSDVSFIFGDERRAFTIPAKDMLTDVQVGNKYVSAIQGGSDVWMLGSGFIKNQYIVFDFYAQAIGLGKRSDY